MALYLRNRLYYQLFRRQPALHTVHVAPEEWRPEGQGLVRHPAVPGLGLLRRGFGAEELRASAALLEALPGWNGYELGREMLALHVDAPPEGLDAFAAPATWPRLAALQGPGAEALRRMQRTAALPRCLFVQAQRLQPGAEVTPHRDAVPCGGHAIATVVLRGSSLVRLGHLSFTVAAGDLYTLEHEARYDMEHAVAPSREESASEPRTLPEIASKSMNMCRERPQIGGDRTIPQLLDAFGPFSGLSLTFRYGLATRPLPELHCEALRDRGGTSALYD